MKRRLMVCLCVSAALVLFSQAAMAGTRVYVNFGAPVVDLVVHGGGAYSDDYRVEGSLRFERGCLPLERVYVVREVVPCPDYIWIDGYYRWERPRHVWIPGHWERASHHRDVVYVQRRWKGPQHDRRDWGRDEDRNEDRGKGHWKFDK